MIGGRMASQRNLIATAAALLLVGYSCARQESPQSTGAGAMDSTTEAHRIWNVHERTLTDIRNGHEFTESDFTAAVDFFVRTTGIPSHDSGTYVGRIPNDQLVGDLERWRAWYVENEPFLRWDPVQRRVRVDEDAKSRCRTSG